MIAIFTAGSLHESLGGRRTDNAFYFIARCARARREYNRPMKGERRPDVERLPADLDRFLGDFFDRRSWRAEIKYDPAENVLFLDVRLESGRLCEDDRFFSLVEYFARAHREALRRAGGLAFRCRLFDPDGADLSTLLHQRGSAYLDDLGYDSSMRRRLAWLGLRRRLVRAVLPSSLMWAGAIVLVTGPIGLPLPTAIVVALGAVVVQAALASTSASARR